MDSMHDLLKEHGGLGTESASGPCLAAWRVLLHAQRDPEALRRWWGDHGLACDACHAAVGRVGEAARLLGVPRVLRMAGSAAAELAWAAASDWIDPRAPLPQVTFRRLDAVEGTDLASIWCVSCDERLLLLLCGDGLDAWRDGVRMHREDGGAAIDFVPADGPTSRAFCPGGRFRDLPALCLVSREPIAIVTESPVTLPGLVRGRLRLELLRETSEPGEDEIHDLVGRNRVTRFLGSLAEDAPTADQRATCEFYLRLLLRQERVPRGYRERLRSLAWLSDDVRQMLETGA